MNLDKTAVKAFKTADEHGFWPWAGPFQDPQDLLALSQKLLLIQSEVTEAMNELRSLPEDGDAVVHSEFVSELADIVIRTLDVVGFMSLEHYGLSFEEIIKDKMATNEKRPAKHGKRF